MNAYDYYITPQEYEIAAANGICRNTLENRIRNLVWGKEKAITVKPRQMKEYPKSIKELAKSNGINLITLRTRVNTFGWSLEKAATEPLQDIKTITMKANESRRKYPKMYLEKAKENGISKGTFYKRIKIGWDLERSASTPPMPFEEICKLGTAKRKAYHNKIIKLCSLKTKNRKYLKIIKTPTFET